MPASTRFFRGNDLAYMAVSATFIAALSIISGFDVGLAPLTLQTVGIGLVGLYLGPQRGFASVLLYPLVGTAGLPISAKGETELASPIGPMGSYLAAFPLVALLTGFVTVLALKQGLGTNIPVTFFPGLPTGHYLIILPLGVLGLMRAGGVDSGKAFGIDMRFWVSDAIKSVIAVTLVYTVHRAFPHLLAQR